MRGRNAPTNPQPVAASPRTCHRARLFIFIAPFIAPFMA